MLLNLSGCGTALVTPFTAGGLVDYEAYRALVKEQVEAGIHFLVALGTTAETPCLSNDEKILLLQITKEVAGEIPVVVGAGTNSTAATAENMKLLEQYGADAFLVVTPYYNKPTQNGLYRHFSAVAAVTELPILLYNVPGRTGVNLAAQTTLKLAEIPNIVAVKEASGNYSQICEIIRNAPEGFGVFSGNDDETFSLVSSGARGVISVASNIVPAMMVRLVELTAAGQMQEARRLHYQLWPLFKNCFVESNPIPVKAGLSILGKMQNVLRAPLAEASDTTMKLMSDTLEGLGLLK